MKFYVDVDVPAVVIEHREFREPVQVIGRPVRGRFLFTTHDAHIHHCTFIGESVPLLSIEGVYGAMIDHCCLGYRRA